MKINESAIGLRADVLVTQRYSNFSRSTLLTLFDRQLVTINGKPAKPGQKIRLGDKLSIDDKILKKIPSKIDLPIIYEDKDVLVINKPAGILTHSKGTFNEEPTVASFIRDKIDQSLTGNRAGIVHRLDRATSGVIICAKNLPTQTWLQKQYSQRKVQKQYLAIVEGKLKTQRAIIDAPIARNPKNPRSFMVNNHGKSAQTEYRVIESFQRAGKAYSVVSLKPVTGRTNQIRVHLKFIGHPIVGDDLYGHPGGNLMLHARQLKITLPGGKNTVFSVPEPQYFKDFLK